MFGERDFITQSTHLPSSCYYILQISYWGWYPVILLCTFTNTRKTPTRCAKKYLCSPKINCMVSMPSARTIKARNGKYYKSNAESVRSRKRDNYQNNLQIKRMPRERVTTLTLTKQRKPLVSNIIII